MPRCHRRARTNEQLAISWTPLPTFALDIRALATSCSPSATVRRQVVQCFASSQERSPLRWRTRVGLAYADDCLEFGFTWRRDYASLADAERGDTFHVYFALRHLGFRR